MSSAGIDGHLYALAEAWPFFSEVASKQQTTALRRTSTGLLDADARRIADELEPALRRHAGGASLSSLEALRDRAWFDNLPTGDRRIADLLVRLAGRIAQPDGDRVVMRRDDDYCTHVEEYRWLSLLLPSDLLVAALGSQRPGTEPPCDHVSLLTPMLQGVLTEAPVAETHLHLGAAVPFPLLWTGLVGHWRTDAPEFQSETIRLPFGTAAAFASLLLAASVGRLLLGWFLSTPRTTSFARFATAALQGWARASAHRAGRIDLEHELRAALRLLATCDGSESPGLTRLARLYCHAVGTVPSHQATSIDELIRRDPLVACFGPDRGRGLPETQFLKRALCHLNSGRNPDAPFERLFWQYVRVRNQLFRYLVVEPGTSGLDWFTRHYDRIGRLRKPFSAVRFAVAINVAARDVRLGAIEGRTVPEPNWAEVRNELRGAGRQAAEFVSTPGQARPEVGILFHFIKASEGYWGRQRRSHADPRQLAHGVRFGAWFHDQNKRAMAIARALREHPELLVVLRGVDVAATELSVPTWAFALLLHRVREAAVGAATVLARRAPTWRVSPLRVTCHVGEEYRRLAEGLRRIHELLEMGLITVGDRLGHALALGECPEAWARRWRVTRQPREERLDDLLWEMDSIAHAGIDASPARTAAIRAEARLLGSHVYGETIDVEVLLDARRMRHDASRLHRLGFPFPRFTMCEAEDQVSRVWIRHLRDPAVFLRGRVPVEVHVTSAEQTFLVQAQAWLRGLLSAREVTIESNPSSNLLVGDFGTFEHHPSLRIQPLSRSRDRAIASPPLSINSDDPLSFATSLSDEYAYVYSALLRTGAGARDALAWIEDRRRDGYRSRFTLACSSDKAVLDVVGARPTERSGIRRAE